jgi:hypothetical protein
MRENFSLGKNTRSQVQNGLREMGRGIFETIPVPNEQENINFVQKFSTVLLKTVWKWRHGKRNHPAA